MKKEKIDIISEEIGLDIIEVTDSKPLIEYKDYLRKRIENNENVEFEESDINKRINPKLSFESVKSIIVVAISYNTVYTRKLENKNKLYGKLSTISFGVDYHKVLSDKMEILANRLKEIDSNFEYRRVVDTGPLLEKAIAKKAGIGWQGKNTLIINNKYGSKISIGYLLTNIEFEMFEENKKILDYNDCGDCKICISACPTKALNGDYTMNSKKCISYLTQTKNTIPYDLRDKMGIQVYGCDICQSVCPHNIGVYLTKFECFLPKKTFGLVDIEELFLMNNSEFKKKYGDMTGSWRGKNILLRNSAIALANIRNERAYKLLIKNINNSSEMVREYIYWALFLYRREHPEVLSIIEREIQFEKEILKDEIYKLMSNNILGG